MTDQESNTAADINVGDSMALSIRFSMKEMGTPKAEERITTMRNAVNNRAQYLRRRYDYEFESNLVDAVTADRKHVVVTFISTRTK